MRPSAAAVSLYVSLVLVVSSVSTAFKTLDSIDDLKNINFGQDVPEHILLLLHWFANEVEIDNDDVIRLNFNPNRDYGSHYYRNDERLLPSGYQYYTVGNINRFTFMPLPDYVTRPQTHDVRSNLARIIFRVQENSGGQIIDQVYITQHYGTAYAGTKYDPHRTYQVTTHLLRQIRQFSVEENNRNSLDHLRDNFELWDVDDSELEQLTETWGNLACLGLLLFIVTRDQRFLNQQDNNVTRDQHFLNQQDNRQQQVAGRNSQPDHTVVDIPESGWSDNSESCMIVPIVVLILIVFVVIWIFH